MFHLIPFIRTAGYVGIFAIIFAETGLLIGFFFPGDTLLFSAGILAARGHLDISLLIGVAILAAVLGDSLGYFIGRSIGPKVFARTESYFFKKSSVQRAERFFAKYGGKTVVLARYVPVVRTFVPAVAGVGRMPYRSFLFYNVLGGALWCLSICLAGFFLGTRIPNIDAYVLPAIIVIFVVSFVPVIIELMVSRRNSTK